MDIYWNICKSSGTKSEQNRGAPDIGGRIQRMKDIQDEDCRDWF